MKMRSKVIIIGLVISSLLVVDVVLRLLIVQRIRAVEDRFPYRLAPAKYQQMSPRDWAAWCNLTHALDARDNERLGKMLEVKREDIATDIRCMPVTAGEHILHVYVVSIKNISQREIIILEPSLHIRKRTREGDTEKYVIDVTFAIAGATWCRVLRASDACHYAFVLESAPDMKVETTINLLFPALRREGGEEDLFYPVIVRDLIVDCGTNVASPQIVGGRRE